MIVTEEEARQKTCHKTLSATVVVAGEANFYPAPCLGSQCMAWRQVRIKRALSPLVKEAAPSVVQYLRAGMFINAIKERRTLTGEPLKEAKEYCERLRSELAAPTSPHSRGYCGLAGKVTP